MNIIRSRFHILKNSPIYFNIFRNSGLKSLKIPSKLATIRSNCTQIASQKTLLDNTNIIKDVILFKYENPRFYKIVNSFAIVQYIFWTYVGITAKTQLRDVPVDESKLLASDPWYKRINLGASNWRYGITVSCVTIGFLILASTWMFTLRSVKYLVLHKGGQAVSVVTYTPLGFNRIMKVDLPYVSCQQTRGASRVQLPLKIKGKMWHYMLDMRGEFRNAQLFDSTAGLYRGF